MSEREIAEDVRRAATVAVVNFETLIQSGEFEGLDPDGTDARDALIAEIERVILAERERCAAVAKAMLVYADTTSGADEAIPAAIMDPNHWLAKNPERATSIRQGSPK
jgi:hypothetical protein